MNKVNWLQLGGVPLRNDDWNFEAEAVREALKGIGSMLGANALLSGCVPSPSGSGYVFSEGYVLIHGEVCYVPAVTVPIPFDEEHNFFQIIENTVSPDGDVILENGLPANIYRQRIAVIGYDPDNLPPNSISWLTAYNNRFSAKALAAVVSQTILPHKGIFWRRANSALSIVSGTISFDNAAYNFAVVNTNHSTLQNINLTLAGGQQPCLFALKVAGNGFLKVEHGAIHCNGQRDHYFDVGDTLLFVNDGQTLSDATHLVNEGESDVWHTVPVTDYGAGVAGALNGLHFKIENDTLLIDGAVSIQNKVTFVAGGNRICTLPASHRPVSLKRFCVAQYDATATEPVKTAVADIAPNGEVKISSSGAPADNYYFSVKVSLKN
jgi:hypothetical protein